MNPFETFLFQFSILTLTCSLSLTIDDRPISEKGFHGANLDLFSSGIRKNIAVK